jgi:TonB family protein
MCRKVFMIVFATFLLGGAAFCQDIHDEDPGWLKYQHVLRASTAEWLESEPFLVKVEYQLYDLAGNPGVKGTAEEQWGDIENPHVSIESSSLKFDGLESPEKSIIENTRENYLVHQALHGIVRPFSAPMPKKDFVMDEFQQNFGEGPIDCFALARPGTRNAATPSYCTDVDGRLTILAGNGPFVLRRSDLRKFRDHWVPMDIALTYGGKTALTVHVLEFDTLQANRTTKAVSAIAKDRSMTIPGDVIAAQILKKPEPKFPSKAKVAHIGGTVVLTAVITKEGKIAGLDVVSSPDPLLSKSATDAVQQWTYKPYLLNGQPTLVHTSISVNYSFNR